MPEYTKYLKGSEWRKWDLHVHSPASFHWNEGKKLQEMDEAEKKESIEKFIKTVNDSSVDVFCIMDYWTFNWYTEIKKYLNLNPNVLNKTIFPGMELRVECPVDYRLNIHVILSDKLTEQQIIDFKSELIIRSIDRKLSEEALKDLAKSFDKSKAAHHGYRDPRQLDDSELLGLGSITAEITKESLKNAFEHIPKNSGFVILPYDTSDGLLKLDWKNHPQDDNYFMQTADIFETRDQRNIDLFNGIKTVANKDFYKNFYKTIGEKPKPCISGSDAHKFSEYGKYPSNKITWIKADPTFEGLKQIIFEPVGRVKIQEIKPDEKKKYETIRRVRFIDNNMIHKDFSNEWICFNPNLNSIIGGKSSGKSLLMYHIAKTIDSNRILEINKDDSQRKKLEYEFEKSDKFSFEVEWDDATLQKLNETPSKTRPITYLPQLYLNRLAEDKIKELYLIVETLLKNNEEYNKFRIEKEEAISLIIQKLTGEIERNFLLQNQIETLNNELKQLGDKSAIITSLEDILEKINLLRKESKFTEEDELTFRELSERKSSIVKDTEFQQKRLNVISDFKNGLDILIKGSFTEFIISEQSKLFYKYEPIDEKIIAEMQTLAEKLGGEIQDLVKVFIENNFSTIIEIQSKLEENDRSNKEIDIQIKPFTKKIKNQTLFDKLNKNKTEEEYKIKIFENKEIAFKNLSVKLIESKNKVMQLYRDLFLSYNEIVLKNKEYNKFNDSDIELNSNLDFDLDKFNEGFSAKITKNTNLSNIFTDKQFNGNLYI